MILFLLEKDKAYIKNNTDIGAAGILSFIRRNIRQQALVHLLRGYEMLGVSFWAQDRAEREHETRVKQK